jgi:hypothetical protein
MAEHAVTGPLGEAHLGDQHRVDPVGAALAHRAGEGRALGGQRVEAVPQGAQGPLVVAGADLAGVDQPAVPVVVADQQRAEAGP